MSKDMRDITRCAVCGRTLKADRTHVDTCGQRCFKELLKSQRVARNVSTTIQRADIIGRKVR